MAKWLSTDQQTRDHNGMRYVCAACGHNESPGDPLVLDAESGMRVHSSHYKTPGNGYYGTGHQ